MKNKGMAMLLAVSFLVACVTSVGTGAIGSYARQTPATAVPVSIGQPGYARDCGDEDGFGLGLAVAAAAAAAASGGSSSAAAVGVAALGMGGFASLPTSAHSHSGTVAYNPMDFSGFDN